MSLVLAIEISNPSAWSPEVPVRPGVALAGVGGAVVASREIDPTRPQDDELVPLIDELFVSSGRRRSELARIAVSIGPGGFTATRIAVTTAKLISFATGAACYPVPSAAVAAAGVDGATGDIVVALASKGESVYAVRFDRAGAPVGVEAIAESAVVDLSGAHTLVADRFAPESLVKRAREMGVRVELPRFDAEVLARIHARFMSCSAWELMPRYPREPEAVTKWREAKRRSGGR